MRKEKNHSCESQGKATREARGGRAAFPDADFALAGDRTSNFGVVLFSCTVFAVAFLVVFAAGLLVAGSVTVLGIVVALIVAFLASLSLHVAQDWERIVVLRLGTFNRVSGPGLFWTIPLLEHNTARIDMRMRVTTFSARETLTDDLVPLDVDAVLFWMVYDPKAACLEVGDFSRSVQLAAQAALREAVGRSSAAEVAVKRRQLDRELAEKLSDQADAWGVSIVGVEVRDILLPYELQDAMSAEAQAEARKKARLILAEAETDIGAMLADASACYEGNEDALRLRNMHMLYESVRETGGTVVLPSSFADGLGDVLPDSVKQPK